MRFILTQSIALFANTWWKQGYYRAGGPPICEEGWVAAPCNDFALSRSISVASTQALIGFPVGTPRRNPSVAHSKEESGTSFVMPIAAVPFAIFESTGSIIIRTVSVPVIPVGRIAPPIGVLNH